MLGRFMPSGFGQEVATNCASRFLRGLPEETRLVVLFGLGAKQGCVAQARSFITSARLESWRTVNEVAYSEGKTTVVHVEHFRVQGAHLSNWLERMRVLGPLGGIPVRQGVSGALAKGGEGGST